jgi:hypothetical protein
MPDSPTRGEVKLPGLGPTKKKYLLYAGIAGIGVVAFFWWKGNQAAPIDPNAVPADPANIDDRINPNTVDVGQGATISDGSSTITTNAQWTTDVLGKLADIGWDPITASVALGKYLAHAALNPTEVTIVQAALGLDGPPPQGTYGVIVAPPVTTVPPPSNVPGKTTPPARVTGLHVHAHPKGGPVDLSWNQASGAAKYQISRNGSPINYPEHNFAQVGNVTATYTVKAINSAGVYGPSSAPLLVRKS